MTQTKWWRSRGARGTRARGGQAAPAWLALGLAVTLTACAGHKAIVDSSAGRASTPTEEVKPSGSAGTRDDRPAEPAQRPEPPTLAELPVVDPSLAPPGNDWALWDEVARRSSSPAVKHFPASTFMHVLHAGHPVAIVGALPWPEAADAPSEARWEQLLLRHGKTTVHRTSDDAIVLVTPLRLGAATRAARRLKGKKLQTFDTAGQACSGRAGDPVEVLYLDHSLYVPEDDEPFDPWDELGSLSEITEFLRTNRGTRYIGLPIRGPEPCAQAVWARAASPKTPPGAAVAAPPPDVVERARRSLLESQPSRVARALFHAAGEGHWLDIEEYNLRRGGTRHLDPADDRIVVRIATVGGASWVTATGRGGQDLCSSAPATQLFHAWTVAGDRWTPLTAPKLGAAVIPTQALDIDGDGHWELLEHGPGGAALHTLREGELIERAPVLRPVFWVGC